MFERTLQIIDDNIFKRMQQVKICLVGIGGVGGSALEALVRLGFVNITIIDHDYIEESNLNRQIITNTHNIGKLKVEEAKKRALAINPQVNIKTISSFLNEDNIDQILENQYDYILDACDTVATKLLLIQKSLNNNFKLISAMGTGNRFNPMDVVITTLDKTYNDPLASVMRSLLRKKKLSLKIPVVWSSEVPVHTNTRKPGSIPLVPHMAGLLMAYFVLNDLKKTMS